MLEEHLVRLVKDLDLPPLSEKDGEGYFQLSIRQDLSISLKDLSPGMFIFAFVGSCPTHNKEDFLIYMMQANFLGQGTGEQVLGMTLDEKFLTLSRSITYELNYEKFKDILEEFVNYLIYWESTIKKMQNQQFVS